jgi:hypothetical protein
MNQQRTDWAGNIIKVGDICPVYRIYKPKIKLEPFEMAMSNYIGVPPDKSKPDWTLVTTFEITEFNPNDHKTFIYTRDGFDSEKIYKVPINSKYLNQVENKDEYILCIKDVSDCRDIFRLFRS